MRIMIADDEKWVRATIKSLIPFEKLGMELMCEAANGIEALELCRSGMPDILLTDIMMPGLTGLDLIKELKECAPNLKIAIISGYSDFEYAKTAMKYGINDYLLKPVDEAELIQVLEKFKHALCEQERQKDAKLREKEAYRRALPVMCEAFLNRVVSGNYLTAEGIRSELSKYGVSLPGQYFSIAVISPDDVHAFDSRENSNYFKTIVKRVMKKALKAVSFTNPANSRAVISIFSLDCKDNGSFMPAFEMIARLVNRRFDTTVSAGISAPTRQLGMLPQLYVQALTALDARFFKNPRGIHHYTASGFSEDVPVQLTEELLNKIVLNLKLSNIQTAFSYIDNVASTFRQHGNIKPELVREFFWQLVQSIISMLNIQIPFIRHESMLTGEHPYERIRSALFLAQLEGYTRDVLQNIFDFYHDRNPVNNANLVENAKRVIETNYFGDISLEQVAKHVHLSPAYLSELFKKETGMSFIDYKTIVRMENAKKLLNSTSLNIYDISSKVGYSDPKYFSKLFKKITGKTVYEYRKEGCRP